MNYRKKYIETKRVALQHFKALMKIALQEKNRELFLKYQDKVTQLTFELGAGLIG